MPTLSPEPSPRTIRASRHWRPTSSGAAAHGRPAERERALLGELLERSRSRHAARLARIPQPSFPEDLPIAQHREEIARLVSRAPRDHRLRRDRIGQDHPDPEDLPRRWGAGRRGSSAARSRGASPRAASRTASRRSSPGTPKGFVGHKIRFQDADAARHRGQGHDRRRSCSPRPTPTASCAPTTRSSSTRRTSAASTSISCWGT